MPDNIMTAETFINNMLGEMIDQIVNGQSKLPPDQQNKLKGDIPFKDANFFTWCTPGIPVMPEDFAFLKGLRQPMDYEKFKDLPDDQKENMKGDESYALTVAMDNFSVLVDTVPNKSGAIDSIQVWEPQNRISHIYESVLKDSEVADTVPSADAQERINKIRSQLVETTERTDTDTGEKFTEERPSKMVMAYNKYATEYLNAYSAYVDMMNKAITGNAGDVQKASILGPQYYNTVSQAYSNWESSGYKSEYEKLVADLAQLQGISMSQLKKEYLDMFTKSRRTSFLDSGDYNVARIVPASFYESGGWTNYSFKTSDLKQTDTSKTQKYSGGARYGFFFGGRGSYEQLDSVNNMNFENFEMSFDLTQVPVVRSWFREDFLLSTKWRPKGGASDSGAVNPGELLSNGNIDKPDGKLFAYPTVVLFARNIKVSKTIYDKMVTEANKSGGGGAGFSLGPISIGGKGSYNKTDRNIQAHQEGDNMVVSGMQIIGFRNHILPLCPNPDPAVKAWI